MNTVAVVLAAGQGTRMKSKLPKVLHKALGKPMVQWVIDVLKTAGVEKQILVLGHGREQVAQVVGDQAETVVQEEQLGTGHAVMQAAPKITDEFDTVLVICGDTPLLKADTIRSLINQHALEGNAVTVLTATTANPTGYGRIIRDGQQIKAIVEQKDATEEQKLIQEINTGTYCFSKDFLLSYLNRLDTNNAQKEYYLTDLLRLANEDGYHVGGCILQDFRESLGVNNRLQLSQAEAVLRQRKCEEVMLAGVTLIDPASTYIDADVEIGADTVIYPNVLLQGNTKIGCDNIIGMNCQFNNAVIGDGNDIQSTIIVDSKVGNHCKMGPMAYIRPGSVLADNVKIGDFVEVKKSEIGEGSKLPHLSYVGDSIVGKNVNIGCGSITCNYDGVNKFQTIIKDNAFIGSNTNLVAPVTVEENAFIGAGSTITKNVDADSLAVVRAELKVKQNWNRYNQKKK